MTSPYLTKTDVSEETAKAYIAEQNFANNINVALQRLRAIEGILSNAIYTRVDDKGGVIKLAKSNLIELSLAIDRAEKALGGVG